MEAGVLGNLLEAGNRK